MYDLFTSFGVNDGILVDVLSRPPFSTDLSHRKGDYIGISARLKELIVLSMKVAASFSKPHAGVEDFLLALFRAETEAWFYQLLDFIGITPKDFETQTTDINKLIASATAQKNGQAPGLFGPIEEIMHMIEDVFGGVK